MTIERQQEIAIQVEAWKEIESTMSTRQALFALYDDRMITGPELDQLMDKLQWIW